MALRLLCADQRSAHRCADNAAEYNTAEHDAIGARHAYLVKDIEPVVADGGTNKGGIGAQPASPGSIIDWDVSAARAAAGELRHAITNDGAHYACRVWKARSKTQ